jgi:hypothetical protein
MQDSETGSLTGQTLDNYLLRGLLGIGGMAEVYDAIDLTLDREVAIKVLPASLATDEHYVRHFWTEAKQVAALNHPHIVPIYGFGEERGLFYHVMPLLQGSLRDRLQHESRLAPEEAVRLTRQVASALEAAHALGLVHRDVKPENILLDANGDALLTDFGIAREVAVLKQQGGARTLARTGLPVGTPEYMAPEQLRGESTDQRADVYGLGAVLYELLVGTPPFQADTPYAIAAQVLMAPLAPPSTYNGAIWHALEQVVLKALARDADERYPDVQHFSAALELALDRTDAVGTAPTLPTLLPLRLSTGVVGVVAQLRGRPARQMVALALAVLLLAGATSGAVVLLHNGAASAASGDTPVATATMQSVPTERCRACQRPPRRPVPPRPHWRRTPRPRRTPHPHQPRHSSFGRCRWCSPPVCRIPPRASPPRRSPIPPIRRWGGSGRINSTPAAFISRSATTAAPQASKWTGPATGHPASRRGGSTR